MDKVFKLSAEEQEKYLKQGSMVFDGEPNSSHVLDASKGVPGVDSSVPGATLESQPKAKLFLQTLVNLRSKIDELIGKGWTLTDAHGIAADKVEKALHTSWMKGGPEEKRRTRSTHAAVTEAATPVRSERKRPANNGGSSSSNKKLRGG